MRAFLTLLAFVVTPALADDWKNRPDDTLFDEAGLQERLAGQTLVFFDDGESVYRDDGYYSYTYGGGGTWEGRWEVKPDSVVCVTFVTEVTRCDRIVENAGRLIVLTSEGERFPIRN